MQRLPTARERLRAKMERHPGIVVDLVDDHAVECIARGHIAADDVQRAQHSLHRIFTESPAPARFRVLFDGSQIDSFARGLLGKWIRWWPSHMRYVARVAFVSRPGSLTTIATMFRYVLRQLPVAIFTDRRAAQSWLQSANDPNDST